jgi:hypothetical protein
MNNHGTAFEGRFALLRERVEAMVAIWTHDKGRVSRQARRLRPDLHVAEARPEAASADPRRRRVPGRRAPRRCATATAGSRSQGRADDITAQVAEFRKIAARRAAIPLRSRSARSARAARTTWSRAIATRGFDRLVSGCRPRIARRSCRCSTGSPRSLA